MKYVKILAGAALLGLAAGGYAVVRSIHHGFNPGMMEHLSATYEKFAAFDQNKDGQLDAAEKDSLAKAIADGSLVLPPHTPPEGMFPTEEERLNHMARMYGRFAAYDLNHDGVLDSSEQSGISRALESGELSLPGANRPHPLGKSLHSW